VGPEIRENQSICIGATGTIDAIVSIELVWKVVALIRIARISVVA
jgi:hypothetical protein